MSRLPTPGSDTGQWGQILNDYLSQEHNADGTLKKISLIEGAQQQSQKAQADGYAPLDSNGIVPTIHLPAAITPPDASSSTKGLVQLSGDLGGTAASPNVPTLANKVDTSDSRLTDPRLTVTKNDSPLPGGAGAGTRKKLNFMDGSNITLTIADNAGSDTVDVTIDQPTPAATIDPAIVDAKGDLIVTTASDTPVRLASGSNGQILSADSSQTTGLAWKTIPDNSHIIQKDGAAATVRPTIDFEGNAEMVTDDTSGNRTRVFISREYLNVTDPRIGVVMQGGGGGGGNQGPKLQAAIDLVASTGGGCVFIPPGTLTTTQEIIFPDTAAVRLLGARTSDFAGSASGIFVNTIAGSNKYAFRLSSTVAHRIESLAISGPGSGIVYGSMPSANYGIYCPGRCLLKNVSVGGFGAGIGVIGSNQEFRACKFSGNGYGMEWLDNPSSVVTRDQLIERCFFTNNTRSGISIADSSSMVNVRFKGNGHFGTAPFGIYRYANSNGSTPQPIAMQNVVFENWSFEGCHNATIYDEPQNGIWKNIVFDSAGESSTFAWQPWPGKPLDLASIDIGYAENIHWREADWSYFAPHPQLSAYSIKNIWVDSPSRLNTVLDDPTIRLLELKAGGSVVENIQIGYRTRITTASCGGVRIADETINRYELVELTDNGHVRRSRNDAGSLILGISCGTYAAGELCQFITRGDTFLVKCINKSGSSIAKGALIKPDPANIGCVKQASGPSDGPIMGNANDAIIPNNSSGMIGLSLT
jgi:hypothetical protein